MQEGKKNELTGRTRMMALILAREGGLIESTNGAGERTIVLTEEAQAFITSPDGQEFIKEVRAQCPTRSQ